MFKPPSRWISAAVNHLCKQKEQKIINGWLKMLNSAESPAHNGCLCHRCSWHNPCNKGWRREYIVPRALVCTCWWTCYIPSRCRSSAETMAMFAHRSTPRRTWAVETFHQVLPLLNVYWQWTKFYQCFQNSQNISNLKCLPCWNLGKFLCPIW